MRTKSIRDIAKLSGLSTATVSRYINKSGYVSEATAKRIQNVLDEHDYHPNKLTNAIFTGHTNDIGLIVQNILNPFFAELVNELEFQAQAKGFNLVVCNANGIKENEQKYYHELVGKRVAGILVMNTTDEQIYNRTTIPIVGIEKRINGGKKVITDNHLGVEKLLEHLTLTNRKVLIIKGSEENYSSRIRSKLFVEYCQTNNIDYTVKQIADEFVDLKNIDSIDLCQFEIVICWNDLVAHKVYGHATASGLQVPNELQISGYDGLSLNVVFPYQLTTIKQDYEMLGKSAIEKIEQLIDKQEVVDSYIEPQLVVGNTTK